MKQVQKKTPQKTKPSTETNIIEHCSRPGCLGGSFPPNLHILFLFLQPSGSNPNTGSSLRTTRGVVRR